jgi:hypothetical protein
MSGACSAHWGEGERVYVIAEKARRRRPLGRPRHRWVDNKQFIHIPVLELFVMLQATGFSCGM